jgi:endonuclease-8
MPEGPEIRRAADKVARRLVGGALTSIKLPYPPISEFEGVLGEASVESVTSRGKALLMRFDNGLTLYSHSQLYGRWTVNRISTKVRWNRSLRAEFVSKGHAVRLWSATDVEVIPTKDEEAHPYIAKLGPDVLDETTSPDVIKNRLESPRFNGRSAASLMLDQSFVAGLGNYLRSEILHQAGVHPKARPKDLDVESVTKWGSLTKAISIRSYESNGLTVSDELAGRRKDMGERRRSYRHSAFCRVGRDCHICGATIIRIRVSGRRLDMCPECQVES